MHCFIAAKESQTRCKIDDALYKDGDGDDGADDDDDDYDDDDDGVDGDDDLHSSANDLDSIYVQCTSGLYPRCFRNRIQSSDRTRMDANCNKKLIDAAVENMLMQPRG